MFVDHDTLQERTKTHTRLVVFLLDFEQFEPSVIQDLFEICRSAECSCMSHIELECLISQSCHTPLAPCIHSFTIITT